MNRFYRQFDHTSDLGVEVRGKDLRELFANAALCLTDLIAGISSIAPNVRKKIQVHADDRELLLREFLAEVLYCFHVHKFLPAKVEIGGFQDAELSVLLLGDYLDLNRHPVKREIKSVTFHQLKIEEKSGGFKARFIMDI
ncbi:MAG: archease [Fidelibacterota bacterium]